MENIGIHIKQVRKSLNMTLSQLSDATGLSIAYLSKMERGLNNVTISNLNNICRALNIDIASMLSHKDDNHTVIRANQRETIFENDYTTLQSLCDPAATGVTFSCTIIKENNPHPNAHAHSFDEIGVAVSGVTNAVIDGVSHVLYPGDSIHIQANSPRYLEKMSDVDAVSYWIHMSIKEK